MYLYVLLSVLLIGVARGQSNTEKFIAASLFTKWSETPFLLEAR